MSFKIKDLMRTEIDTIDVNSTILKSAKMMSKNKRNEGYIIILEKGKPVGIVTERDIVNKGVAKGLDPSKTKISEIMSTPLITINPDEDMLDASNLMVEKNVRKLVVTKDEIIYGIITSKDIAQQCGRYVDKSVKDIIKWSMPLGVM
jgi:CBS domain-containing protein